MSGTFMDGGGHDHGGHAVHHSGGESFMDGGNHDHHHHGGEVAQCGDSYQHHHHGGGHFASEPGKITLGSLFGLNNGQHQHGFLAHLLGLDHDVHHSHGAGMGGTHGSITYQIPFWSVALQSITLSSLFRGVHMTPAVWMLTLFLTFIGWLFVIHGIRHHEPLANKLIGLDHPLRVECRFASPVSPSPVAAGETDHAAHPVAAAFGSPLPGSAGAASLAATPPPQPISAPPISTFAQREFVPAPQVPPPVFAQNAVTVPSYTTSAPRLKVLVTR